MLLEVFMSEKMNQLKEILGEVSDLHHASSVLEWDQNVSMPPGGSEARGQQLGTLGKIAHEKSISDDVGKLLEDLKREYTDLESDDGALIRVSAREFDKATRVPAKFIAKQAIVTTQAFEAWVEAKAKSDFSIFRPHLEQVVDLVHEYISFFLPADHPYDILLDDFEPGMKTAEVQTIFDDLRPKQVELIKAIKSTKQVKDDFLHKKYTEKKVWEFGETIITKLGYDWNRGRQDKAPHPFQTTFSVNDTRITNRYEAGNPLTNLFSAMHEAGHAMYEHFFPALKKTFPTQLDGVSAKSFYKAINKVESSLIRVNADEATYNLHVMLRLELEIGMVEGKFAVKDLPEIWNAKMNDYLGIVPPNDAQGVLQDVHWSSGLMGYFSTYALGNLVSAQLWEKINQDIEDLDEQVRKGKFDSLLGWLRKKIHVHGHKYDPQDLVQKITGSKIDSAAYIRYLTAKYSDIYGL
jgi:carboxypeptidase Taq